MLRNKTSNDKNVFLAEKKKTKLGLAKSSKRTESPAKIDQVMELIGALMDILLAVDIDETPQPDITNELRQVFKLRL